VARDSRQGILTSVNTKSGLSSVDARNSLNVISCLAEDLRFWMSYEEIP
jgi:hypothetical protein